MTGKKDRAFEEVYRHILGLPEDQRWKYIDESVADADHQAKLRELFSPLGEDLFLNPDVERAEQLQEFDIQDGIELGDFHLIRELGRGAMGVVYLAEQKSLGRQVALKLFRPALGAFGFSRERFVQEARAIAKLRHPGIVPVYTVGEATGFPYFALEYVPGRNLAEELAACAAGEATALGATAGTVDFRVAVRMIAEVAEALAHAHGAGILHRDVKPSNIMIDENGEARLTDFGLAKSVLDAPATLSDELKGTVHYMSPEQVRVRGPQQDERSDVYSLGVVLYELLTLRKPFPGESFAQVLHALQRRDAPPPRKHNPRIPRDLALICETAMARHAEDRYQDALQFARDLRCFLDHKAISIEAPSLRHKSLRWAKRHRRGWGLGAAVLASLGLGLQIADSLADEAGTASLQVYAVDDRLNRVGRPALVKLRRIDERAGTLGPTRSLGRLPIEGQQIEAGYYRILVEYEDGWLTEHARDLRAQDELLVRSVYRSEPLLSGEGFVTIAGGVYEVPEQAPETWPFRGESIALGPYELSRTEASLGLYREYLAATGLPAPEWWPSGDWNQNWNSLPVTLLLYEEARDFAEWAGARLPSLLEWQRAAHGSRLRLATWPDFPRSGWRGVTQGEARAFAEQDPGTPEDFLWVVEQLGSVEEARGDQSIGNFDQAPGLIHLFGNVREQTETMGLSVTKDGLQVDRLQRYRTGASWEASVYAQDLRSVGKTGLGATSRQSNLGLRFARSISPSR